MRKLKYLLLFIIFVGCMVSCNNSDNHKGPTTPEEKSKIVDTIETGVKKDVSANSTVINNPNKYEKPESPNKKNDTPLFLINIILSILLCLIVYFLIYCKYIKWKADINKNLQKINISINELKAHPKNESKISQIAEYKITDKDRESIINEAVEEVMICLKYNREEANGKQDVINDYSHQDKILPEVEQKYLYAGGADQNGYFSVRENIDNGTSVYKLTLIDDNRASFEVIDSDIIRKRICEDKEFLDYASNYSGDGSVVITNTKGEAEKNTTNNQWKITKKAVVIFS